MHRRTFLWNCGLVAAMGSRAFAELDASRLKSAEQVLADAVARKQIQAAVMRVTQNETVIQHHFGQGVSNDAMFLLGSISKPISITALMTLYDQHEFQLDDLAQKYLPGFQGDGREKVTIRHLLTHVSGLPDQLPENDRLRREHTDLNTFIEHATRASLSFAPGTRYQYSSMAILLAAGIAKKITGQPFPEFVDQTVYRPLKLKRSAMGLGKFQLTDMVPCQTEFAAPEAGAGDPTAKSWDWNSPYWRGLGAPWGGAHSSAADVTEILGEMLMASGRVLKPETARLMLQNHNPAGLTPRGLGWSISAAAGSPGCSEKTFGHTGSTGTLAWADPVTRTTCVILTSLPARAVQPHPRDVAAVQVAKAMHE